MNKGIFITVEGIDGSGKSTQIEVLAEKLAERGYNVKKLKFPQYDKPSSALVKMYLDGEFGNSPDDVNSYAASAFYAVDRFSWYKKYYNSDSADMDFLLCDRYVSSNIIHQGSKFEGSRAIEYFKWLYDFEYTKLGLPKPDAVFFLDVPPFLTVGQLNKRYNGDEMKKDIHEKDEEYLLKCYNTGSLACEQGFMERIECTDNNNLKSVEDINEIILKKVLKFCE